MSCNFPMIRAETYETYRTKDGKLAHKAEFINRDEFDKFGNDYMKHKYRKISPIGCGQCVGCMLDYSRDKATQMMIHKEYCFNSGTEENPIWGAYPDGTCWFLTETYADEYLKTHKTVNTETGEVFEGVSLCIEDTQKYMKRLRKAYPQMKIQYVMAGEYGSRTLRPHYHHIIYGLPLDQTKFKKVGMNALNQPTWVSEELNNIWGMGHVEIGRVDWRSCAYVARYTLKKALSSKDKNYYATQGMLPEFICWSNGIGKQYYLENGNKIFDLDQVIVPNHMNHLLKPPRSYDRLLKESDPKLYEDIKRKRTKRAQYNEYGLRMQTDLTPEERRAISEARMKSVMEDIRTEV